MNFANLPRRLCPLFATVVPLEKASGVPAAGGETVVDILARAADRARDQAVEYIGLISPEEVNHLLNAVEPGSTGTMSLGAQLVDVRPRRERERTGRLPGSIPIEWNSRSRSKRARDDGFLAELSARVRREQVVIFVSRHGRRSHLAARDAAAGGYAHALSVIDGYEAMRAASVIPGDLADD